MSEPFVASDGRQRETGAAYLGFKPLWSIPFTALDREPHAALVCENDSFFRSDSEFFLPVTRDLKRIGPRPRFQCDVELNGDIVRMSRTPPPHRTDPSPICNRAREAHLHGVADEAKDINHIAFARTVGADEDSHTS